MTEREPRAVERFDEALAEWLASFTAPEALGAEMAEACAAGAAWPAAIGAAAVRRAGWPDAEALAWGVAVGGLAGALEAARRSLAAQGPESRVLDPPAEKSAARRPALGLPPAARALLAADGLIAASHEALGTLAPERLMLALRVLSEEFGGGGPWCRLSGEGPSPAWPALLPCALGPAAAERPDGPWRGYARAWREANARPREVPEATEGPREEPDLWRQPAADAATRDLLKAAAAAARDTSRAVHATRHGV